MVKKEKEDKLQIISVVPITRSMVKNNLSYFTTKDFPLGSVINVPLRKKNVSALIIEKRNVSDLKSEIRKSTFSIKKINNKNSISFLSPAFINSAEKTAKYFATTNGKILNTLIPNKILENTNKLTEIEIFRKVETDIPKEKLVIQMEDEERFANYKSLIREEFAKKSSVFFCLPTIEDIKKAKDSLCKGIENYTFSFSGSETPKELIKKYNKLQEEKHPVLIIGNPSFLFIYRDDLNTIIVDRENSRSYKTIFRPFIDFKYFIEQFAKENTSKLILGDNVLSVETIWRYKNDEFAELTPLKFRTLSGAKCELIDMKKESIKVENEEFKIFSQEVEEILEETKEKNGNCFLFGVRKGLSSTTVCGDCGHVVECDNCGAPVVLYSGRGQKENYFLCHACGNRRSAAEKCKNCDSWKLIPLGIGIEKIEKEIKTRFPNIHIFRLDKDTATTNKKARDIITKFYKTPGSVLLGTEMALIYLNEKVSNIAIISLDSLFGIADFKINEKIFYLITKMRSMSEKNFFVQTRNIGKNILNLALKGNILDFYREEISDRKTFSYPPFFVFIKITIEGTSLLLEKEAKSLQEYLAQWNPQSFRASLLSKDGKGIIHTLIRIPRNEWIDEKLLYKLLLLPPQFVVKVNPDSLL